MLLGGLCRVPLLARLLAQQFQGARVMVAGPGRPEETAARGAAQHAALAARPAAAVRGPGRLALTGARRAVVPASGAPASPSSDEEKAEHQKASGKNKKAKNAKEKAEAERVRRRMAETAAARAAARTDPRAAEDAR